MEYRRLGQTDIMVPAICLGTMTWGFQNTEAEGAAQMDFAIDRGLTFWDTAEMYAVPPTAETYGRTETIIGNWFARTGRRDQVFLATKMIGRPRGGFGWVRGGTNRLDRANITRAVEDSLKRLRTDRIDLFQIHWPDRPLALFGRARPEGGAEDDGAPIAETLGVLAELVAAGKIVHLGVSNETPWGVMAWTRAAEMAGHPRIASIQNVYNLLSRAFDDGLAEVSARERVGLLAYSPLAGGTLTGKYLDGVPPGSRRALDPRPSRYDNPRGMAATRAYVDLARRHGIDPVHMALAFVHGRPFVTSTIIGATSVAQLEHDLKGFAITLPPELLAEIEAIHGSNPTPCP